MRLVVVDNVHDRPSCKLIPSSDNHYQKKKKKRKKNERGSAIKRTDRSSSIAIRSMATCFAATRASLLHSCSKFKSKRDRRNTPATIRFFSFFFFLFRCFVASREQKNESTRLSFESDSIFFLLLLLFLLL